MAWSDVTGTQYTRWKTYEEKYTGWKTYEETLDFTGESAQTIYSSALASFQGNVVLPAAITSTTENITVTADTIKLQISVDGTHWSDMVTGTNPAISAATTGCGISLDVRNIKAPFYRIAITLTPAATGDAVIQYAVKE
ncbi:MAG TPA: hypothetical protein PLQ59_08095 [Fervidobacterium sp.]|nr:hypothetical protein [Fervidobacterium sp.]